jgi:hypothetical protein
MNSKSSKQTPLPLQMNSKPSLTRELLVEKLNKDTEAREQMKFKLSNLPTKNKETKTLLILHIGEMKP